MKKLAGKVAIVTGGSRGMGKACCLALANEGAAVTVNYRKSQDHASKVVDEIVADGGQAIAWQADISNAEEVAAMIDATVKKFKRIDVLVNNAGIITNVPIDKLTEEIWDSMIGVNLKGTYLCSRAVLPSMLQQRSGRIINISSTGGLLAVPHSPAYAAAKAGVMGLTRSMADGLGPNILVNCIAPGATDTDMNLGINSDAMRKLHQETPLKRWGTPQEIADVVVFLATSATFMTGQTIVVDGGLSNVFCHFPGRS